MNFTFDGFRAAPDAQSKQLLVLQNKKLYTDTILNCDGGSFFIHYFVILSRQRSAGNNCPGLGALNSNGQRVINIIKFPIQLVAPILCLCYVGKSTVRASTKIDTIQILELLHVDGSKIRGPLPPPLQRPHNGLDEYHERVIAELSDVHLLFTGPDGMDRLISGTGHIKCAPQPPLLVPLYQCKIEDCKETVGSVEGFLLHVKDNHGVSHGLNFRLRSTPTCFTCPKKKLSQKVLNDPVEFTKHVYECSQKKQAKKEKYSKTIKKAVPDSQKWYEQVDDILPPLPSPPPHGPPTSQKRKKGTPDREVCKRRRVGLEAKDFAVHDGTSDDRSDPWLASFDEADDENDLRPRRLRHGPWLDEMGKAARKPLIQTQYHNTTT